MQKYSFTTPVMLSAFYAIVVTVYMFVVAAVTNT
jgi:hypothetical protein